MLSCQRRPRATPNLLGLSFKRAAYLTRLLSCRGLGVKGVGQKICQSWPRVGRSVLVKRVFVRTWPHACARRIREASLLGATSTQKKTPAVIPQSLNPKNASAHRYRTRLYKLLSENSRDDYKPHFKLNTKKAAHTENMGLLSPVPPKFPADDPLGTLIPTSPQELQHALSTCAGNRLLEGIHAHAVSGKRVPAGLERWA